MPNYCQCTLSVEGAEKDIHAMKTAITSKDEEGKYIPFDFNKVIPMPDSLNISHQSDVMSIYKRDYLIKTLEEYECHHLKGMSPEEYDKASAVAKQYHENLQKYGHITWYEWRIEHWGTKWNAICKDGADFENEDSLYFQTAWSPPLPVIQALSKQFPSLRIELDFYDEFEDETDSQTIAYINGEQVD